MLSKLLAASQPLQYPQDVIDALLLAKLLVLLVLHTAKRVTQPVHWIQAQLNGYDQMVKRTSSCCFFLLIAWADLFLSLLGDDCKCHIRKWFPAVQSAVEQNVTGGAPLICMIDEAQQVFDGCPEWPLGLDAVRGEF